MCCYLAQIHVWLDDTCLCTCLSVFAANLFPYARILQLELGLRMFRLHSEIFPLKEF